MLSSIIEFAMLHRTVAKQAAAVQQSGPPAPAEAKSPHASANEEAGLGMSIQDSTPVFGDAMWEYAGHVTTDRF